MPRLPRNERLHPTELHEAANHVNLKRVNVLLKRPDAREAMDKGNNRRETPLHLAAGAKSPEVVEALLRARANPTRKDRKGKTARTRVEEHIKMLERFRAGIPGTGRNRSAINHQRVFIVDSQIEEFQRIAKMLKDAEGGKFPE